MDEQRIGEKIKDLRNYYGLSQKELSDGICTQAYISQVESGNKNVASHILYQLAERLGVDVDYILFASNNERFDYIMEVERQARALVETKDFHSLMNLVKAEENSPLMEVAHFHQFLLWHKAIAIRYVENNLDQALLVLQDALKLAKTTNKTASEREVHILSNIGNIYAEKEEYLSAIDSYETALSNLRLIPLYETKLETGLLYNLGRVYLIQNQIDKSLACCDEAILLCKRHFTFHGLGESYFIQGHCYKTLDDLEAARTCFMNARSLFSVIDHEKFVEKVDNQLNKLQDCE
ncbi:helix-turn-helix domain-containing protein [Alkalibacillus sp. S2W]|uniref:helix-turn-helix domain-containing protein n=1 Tax=Alkalibacillus sp. S2W TaxID=3386553 RepID=UPI00398C8AC9